MAEIVNLRQVRKRKAQAERAGEAATRRRQFGRTKAEKAADEAERARKLRHIDGHRREPE